MVKTGRVSGCVLLVVRLGKSTYATACVQGVRAHAGALLPIFVEVRSLFDRVRSSGGHVAEAVAVVHTPGGTTGEVSLAVPVL